MTVLTPYRCRVRHGPVLATCLPFGGSCTLVLVLSGTLAHQLLRQELLEEGAIHVVDHLTKAALGSNLFSTS